VIELDTLEELVVSAPARAIEDRSDGELVLTDPSVEPWPK
jgi:hypothetical protein